MKFNTNTLKRAVAIVIAAIGAKLGVKTVFGAGGAETDGTTVYIPAPDANDPEAALVAYGYGIHEAAHVRDTDMDVYQRYARQGPLAASLLNIFEDVRIEKAITRPYPGAVFMLRDLVKVLVNRGRFAAATAQSAPADVLASWLRHSQRAKHLGQKHLEPLAEEGRKLLEQTFEATKVAKLDALLGRIFPLADTDAAGQAMEAVLAIFSEDEDQPDQNSPNQPQGGSGQEQQGQDDSQGQGQGQGQSGDDADNQDGDSGSSAGDEQDGDGNGESQDQGQDGGHDDDQNGDDSGESQGQSQGADGDESQGQGQNGDDEDDQNGDSKARSGGNQDGDDNGENQGQARNGNGAGGNTRLQPETDVSVNTDIVDIAGKLLNETARPVSRSEMSIPESAGLTPRTGTPAEETDHLHPLNARQVSAIIATRIRTLLEDETMTRERPREEGPRLMRNRLARVAMGERNVFARKAIKQAPDAAVYLLLDRSGSMSDDGGEGWSKAKHANTACLALAYALESIKGVTLGVWSYDSILESALLPGQKPGTGRSFNRAPRDSTETAGAMIRVGGELLARANRKKILIVITDGVPNSRSATLEASTTLSEEGIMVIGIGIGAQGANAVQTLFPHSFGIARASELGQQLAVTLRQALQSQQLRSAA